MTGRGQEICPRLAPLMGPPVRRVLNPLVWYADHARGTLLSPARTAQDPIVIGITVIDDHSAATIPACRANAAASVRLRAPSFPKMFETWTLTVFSLM